VLGIVRQHVGVNILRTRFLSSNMATVENVMTGRYLRAHLSPYLSTELRRLYAFSDTPGKLALLSSLQTEGIPQELQRAAASDADPLIGDWLVSHVRFLDDEAEALLLKNDMDGYRQARLIENSEFFFLSIKNGGMEVFTGLSTLERFAVVQCKKVVSRWRLIEALFDLESTELQLPLAEREAMIICFLRNPHLSEIRDLLSGAPQAAPRYELSLEDLVSRESYHGGATSTFGKIWRVVTAWREPYLAVRQEALAFLPGTDQQKAEAYQSLSEPGSRFRILQTCTSRDRSTLALALADTDEEIRALAAQISPPPEPVDEILPGPYAPRLRGYDDKGDPWWYQRRSEQWSADLQKAYFGVASLLRITIVLWLLRRFSVDAFQLTVLCGGILVFNQAERLLWATWRFHQPTLLSMKALHDRLDRRMPPNPDELWNAHYLGEKPRHLLDREDNTKAHWGTRAANKATFDLANSASAFEILWRGSGSITTWIALAVLSWRLAADQDLGWYFASAVVVLFVSFLAWLAGLALLEMLNRSTDPDWKDLMRLKRRAGKLGVLAMAHHFAKQEQPVGERTYFTLDWESFRAVCDLHTHTTLANSPNEVLHRNFRVEVKERQRTVLLVHGSVDRGVSRVDQFVEGPWVDEMGSRIGFVYKKPPVRRWQLTLLCMGGGA